MARISLTDMLNGNELDITISQRGLDTTLYVNKDTGVRTISAHGITLTYDPERFQKDPAAYVAEQLAAHQNYHGLVRCELSDAYRGLDDILKMESDIRRASQFVPENVTRPLIEIVKLALAPIAWLRFRTLNGKLRESVQNENFRAVVYGFIEAIVNYGKNFVDERLAQSNGQLPEAVRTDLTKWGNVQRELSYLYSRLVATADKRVQAEQRMYKLLFPNSADPIQ
jgi:hypothetical protein